MTPDLRHDESDPRRKRRPSALAQRVTHWVTLVCHGDHSPLLENRPWSSLARGIGWASLGSACVLTSMWLLIMAVDSGWSDAWEPTLGGLAALFLLVGTLVGLIGVLALVASQLLPRTRVDLRNRDEVG